jgi:magnesium transporter
MPIAAARVYSEGHRLRALWLNDPDDRPVQPHQFTWIGLVDPDLEELQVLQSRFGLHPLAIEDVLCDHPIPKVSVYGDQIFVTARTARLVGEEIIYGETCAFLCKNNIITVRKGSERGYGQLRRNLEDSPTQLRYGTAYILYALLDFIVDSYQPIVEDIEEEVLAVERRALDAFLSREDVTHLFNLRQELMRFRRMLGPMEEVCARLEHLHLPFMTEQVRPYFRDVGDHVRAVAVPPRACATCWPRCSRSRTCSSSSGRARSPAGSPPGPASWRCRPPVAGLYGHELRVHARAALGIRLRLRPGG